MVSLSFGFCLCLCSIINESPGTAWEPLQSTQNVLSRLMIPILKIKVLKII